MLRRYRPILGVPALRRLLVSSVIGRMPLGTCGLAILLLVRAATHSYATAGLAVGAAAGAQAVLAPIIGRWLDRLGTVRVVAVSAGVQSAALGWLAVAGSRHASAVLLVVLSAIAGAGMPPVAAAARSLWSRLLTDATERDAAFALDAIGQELVWTTGPVIVGVLAALSARLTVLTVAGLTILSSFWFIRTVNALDVGPLPADMTAESRRTSPITRLLTPITILFGVCLGGIEVSMPALAGHLSHPSLSGVFVALWSVGSMAGGIAFGTRQWTVPRHRLLPRLMLVNALLVVPLMLTDAPGVAVVTCLFAGICLAPVFSTLSSLIGQHASPGGTARAFMWNTAAIVTGAAAGSALCGSVISSAGLLASFAVAAGAGLLGGVLALTLSVSLPRIELAPV